MRRRLALRPDSASPAPLARIAVGTVVHARRRPRAHAFRYPALFLRLPMRSLDDALRGQCLLSHNCFNLFSFVDADHGDREHGRPLVEWIDALLRDEGIVDADGELWLQTFPRVFGYAFKPVSFWFCHRRDGALRAVICEVNNTFGERHCYLLAHADGRAISPGEEMTAAKIFHVSPFCEVAGTYRFRFLTAGDRVVARIDYDDAVGPLLSTSISGEPRIATTSTLLSAFARSPLFSFGVVARIHWQAVRLWIKRTPSFSKPAAPRVEVSR
jgi:DUF1365 family protein